MRRELTGAGLAVLGWLIPVGGLILYNFVSLRTATGYDPTNESKPGESFTLSHFYDNWETMLRHLTTNGLFFIFPIAIIGLAWMFAWKRRVAIFMAAWILPCLICYTFYYWAPDGDNIGYLRFFLTIMPGLVVCAMWALGHLTRLMTRHTLSWTTKLAALTVAPLATVLSTAVHLQNDTRDQENNQYRRLMLRTNIDEILAQAKPGSALFCNDYSLMHDLQFMRNYMLFDTNTYHEGFVKNVKKNLDPNDPQTFDPGRAESIFKRLGGFTQADLDEQERKSVEACLDKGMDVYVIENPAGGRRKEHQPPRPLPEVVRKVTVAPKKDDPIPQMYADVIARWRFIVVPAAVSATREDPKPNPPRAQHVIVRTISYDQPWLIYQVSKHELPISPERQAMIDFDTEQKAKAEQAAAEKTAQEKARQLADQQRRDAEKARQDAIRAQRQAAEKAADDRLAAARQQLDQAKRQLDSTQKQLDKTTAEKATAQKQLDQLNSQQASVQKQLNDLKSQEQSASDMVKKDTADKTAAEKSLADLKTQQTAMMATITSQKKQLADLQQQINAAKSDLQRVSEAPTTQPTTQALGE